MKGDKIVSDERIITNLYCNNWEFVVMWNKSVIKFNLTGIMGTRLHKVARLKFLLFIYLFLRPIMMYCVALVHIVFQPVGRQKSGREGHKPTGHILLLLLPSYGQDLVTWPHLSARGSRKCSFYSG